ncbi:MAG: rane-associated protein [Actinomycetota bacterium]|jgi:membrane protein DedA with SNARE-associated domain|nr:rane-associated protein [Actinomycetota bacterium]
MLRASLVEQLVGWLEPAFIVAGYEIIALAVLLERSLFIGLIIPGDIILALGGVFASEGRLNLAWVIVIGIVAALTGESAGFWLGRRFGVTLIRAIPVVRRLEPRLKDAHAYFERHGGKTVAIGRYATAAGAFIPFSAGVSEMPFRRFIAFDAPAVALWATLISGFGYVVGRNLAFIDRTLSRFGYVVLGIAVAAVLIRAVRKKLARSD